MLVGECADGPGGGSGSQNQRSAEFSGGTPTKTQVYGGDAAAGK